MIKFFMADWCRPCQRLKESITEEELRYVQVINVDNEPNEVFLYSIMSVPTLVMVDDEGNEMKRALGTNRQQFLDFCLE